MSVKAVVKTLEEIPEGLRAAYAPIEGGEGFVLDVEDIEAHPKTGPLKRAKDREAKTATEAAAKVRELAAQVEELQDKQRALLAGTLPKDQVSALENSWKEKLGKREAELSGQIESLEGSLRTHMVENVATSLASDLAVQGCASVLLPHLQQRLAYEVIDGKPTTRVLDREGKPSAMTVKELAEEFRSNTAFGPVVLGSKASGGSASAARTGGSAPPTKNISTDPRALAAHVASKMK